jgi:hypothetical protein
VDLDPDNRSARVCPSHVDGSFAATESNVEDHGEPIEYFHPVEELAALVETPSLEPHVELGLALF